MTIRITTVVEDAVNHSMTRFVMLVFYSKVLNKVGSAIALHLIFPYVVMPL